jgi:hypothetical protein
VKSKEEGVGGTGSNPCLPRHDLPKGLKNFAGVSGKLSRGWLGTICCRLWFGRCDGLAVSAYRNSTVVSCRFVLTGD